MNAKREAAIERIRPLSDEEILSGLKRLAGFEAEQSEHARQLTALLGRVRELERACASLLSRVGGGR